jgi:cobalt-zinc-cadmium efflux system membrane fusion protein
VRSPLTGQVAAVTAAPGAVLAAGAELAEIQDTRGRELRFMVSPLLAGNLTPGQVLRVKAGPRELRARVLAIAPDAASAQRLMILRAAAIDADLPPAGSAVSAFVQVPSSQQRWSVPPQAVQIVNGAPVVFRYQRGLAEPLQVVIGEQSPSGVVILQGLRGGETLLSGHTEMLSTALSNRRP